MKFFTLSKLIRLLIWLNPYFFIIFVSAMTSSILFLDNTLPSSSGFPSTRSSSTSLSFQSGLLKRNYKKQITLQQAWLIKPATHNLELIFWQNSFAGCLWVLKNTSILCPFYVQNVHFIVTMLGSWLKKEYCYSYFSRTLTTDFRTTISRTDSPRG